MANSAARRLLSISDDRAIRLGDLCATEAHVRAFREAVARTARGALVGPLQLHTGETTLVATFVRARGNGSIRVVVTLHSESHPRAATGMTETFAIRTTPREFGTVLWHVPRLGHEENLMPAGDLCFDHCLPERSDVCGTCPARSIAAGEQVQRLIPLERGHAVIEVSARVPGVAEVRVLHLTEPILDDLPRARVLARAQRCGLTPRERSVLDEVLNGYTRREISQRLGITAHTVKFHERNLRAKLGADSRVDLLRVLL